MDQQERNKILHSAQLLRERESLEDSWEDPYMDISRKELSMMVSELIRLRKEDQKSMAAKDEQVSQLLNQNNQLLNQNRQLLAGQSESRQQIANMQKQIANLNEQLSKAIELLSKKEAQLKIEQRNHYGSKSQKRNKTNTVDTAGNRNKDDFDGTNPPTNSEPEVKSETEMPSGETEQTKEYRDYRKGMIYDTMKADKIIEHKSDICRLPEGAKIIRHRSSYSFEQITQIVGHRYDVIVYRMPDGTMHEGYFPADGSSEIIDTLPGTHASANLMAHLIYNKYVLDTPLYRELFRIGEEQMQLSRQTLTNWLEKGSLHVKELVKRLKDICLVKDCIINCDETWCRVKVEGCYRKKYIWCLVNKKEKIVIYSYEDGSRGRDALKHILGDCQVKALQSDGYNVYMYLDDHIVNTEHLCCMAHARAKFKYAEEQGDKDAQFFLDLIGQLYELESEYEIAGLNPEEVKVKRNGFKTKDIIIQIRSKLDALLASNHPYRGEMMEKALRYLDTFWKQLFLYIKDGEYTIDNSIAERFIRPLAGERKNSLFFGSNKMAEVSAAYHTIISTCKMKGIPILNYLKTFFKEIINGRRDYGNLLPMTIGIANKH
jgi:transposase